MLGAGRQAKLPDAVPDLVAVDAEKLPCLRVIAAAPLERLGEQLSFQFFEPDSVRW